MTTRRDFLGRLALGAAGLWLAPDALELITEPRRKYWAGHSFGTGWVVRGGVLSRPPYLELQADGRIIPTRYVYDRSVPSGMYFFEPPRGKSLLTASSVSIGWTRLIAR